MVGKIDQSTREDIHAGARMGLGIGIACFGTLSAIKFSYAPPDASLAEILARGGIGFGAGMIALTLGLLLIGSVVKEVSES